MTIARSHVRTAHVRHRFSGARAPDKASAQDTTTRVLCQHAHEYPWHLTPTLVSPPSSPTHNPKKSTPHALVEAQPPSYRAQRHTNARASCTTKPPTLALRRHSTTSASVTIIALHPPTTQLGQRSPRVTFAVFLRHVPVSHANLLPPRHHVLAS